MFFTIKYGGFRFQFSRKPTFMIQQLRLSIGSGPAGPGPACRAPVAVVIPTSTSPRWHGSRRIPGRREESTHCQS